MTGPVAEPPSVLIAEDDPLLRQVIATAASSFGWTPIAVSDGPCALERLTAGDGPRFAVLDWMMPGLDGVEVVRRTRTAGAHRYVYLLLLTARSARADLLEGLGAGADDFLTKPFDPELLQARLETGRRVLERRDAVDAGFPGPAEGAGAPRPKILVAEDDDLSRRLLERHLNLLGYACCLERDGRTAWLRLQHEDYRVVLSDCMMPSLSGIELCRRIRARSGAPYVYVILLTALGEREDHLLGLASGADDFLTKPVDGELLRARLEIAERLLAVSSRRFKSG